MPPWYQVSIIKFLELSIIYQVLSIQNQVSMILNQESRINDQVSSANYLVSSIKYKGAIRGRKDQVIAILKIFVIIINIFHSSDS